MFVSERKNPPILLEKLNESSCLSGKPSRVAAVVVSIVFCVFAICLTLFKSGSLESIVAWSAGSIGICFSLIWQTRIWSLRWKTQPKLEHMENEAFQEKPSETLNADALIQKPPSHRKFRQMRKVGLNSFDELEKHYLTLSQESKLKDELDVNSRLHYHLLSALMDPLFSFCNVRVLKGTGINEKVSQLLHILSLKHQAHLRFLVDETVCQNDLQQGLFVLFQTLIQIGNPVKSSKVSWHNVFQHLKGCCSSTFYKENHPHFSSLSKEKGVKEFPDIVFLQMFVFEIVSQISLNHFFHETLEEAGSNGHLVDNFAAVMWTACFSNSSHSLKNVFLHLGNTDIDDKILQVFFDYCERENFKCLFVQNMESLSSAYNRNITCLSLDLLSENEFFSQEGEWTNIEWNKCQNFMSHLRSVLVSHFSRWIEMKSISFCEKEIIETIEFVHIHFFQKESELNPQKRAIFIRIVCALAIERFSLEHTADFIFFQGLKEREVTIMATLLAISLIRKSNENGARELKQVKLISRLPNLCHKGPKVFPLLENTVQYIFSLSNIQKEEIRKGGISVGGQQYYLFNTLIEDNPSQTHKRLPSEAQTVAQYHEWIAKEVEEKKPLTFIIYYFVQNFFTVSNKQEYIDGLLKQFREKDISRQQCLIEAQKIRLVDFRNRLQKGWKKEEIKNEFPKIPFELIDKIASLEEKTLDPLDFCRQLDGILETTPKFLEFAKNCYFGLREQVLLQYILQNFRQNKERANEVLTLCQQSVLQEMTCFLQQRYNFSPRSSKPLNQNNDKAEEVIHVLQRAPGKSANTCFNLTLAEKHPTIEVYQFYEIDQVSVKNPIYFIVGCGSMDLTSGHKMIHCSLPQKDDPGDMSDFVIRNKKISNILFSQFIE